MPLIGLNNEFTWIFGARAFHLSMVSTTADNAASRVLRVPKLYRSLIDIDRPFPGVFVGAL